MKRCPSCNAPQQEDAEVCTFCNTLTPYGVEMKRERAEQAARHSEEQRFASQADAHSAKAQADVAARQAAKYSLVWGLLGPLMCCLPIGSVVGIGLAVKGRRLAKQHGLVDPPVAGLWVGIGGLILTLAAWAGVGIVAKQEADRKALLKATIEAEASAEQLSASAACALIELELINASYEKYQHANAELSCSGAVIQSGNDAKVTDSHFLMSGKTHSFVACFKRGGRWAVSELRRDDACGTPNPEPPADPSEVPRKRKRR